jgi:hypothetical protein
VTTKSIQWGRATRRKDDVHRWRQQLGSNTAVAAVAAARQRDCGRLVVELVAAAAALEALQQRLGAVMAAAAAAWRWCGSGSVAVAAVVVAAAVVAARQWDGGILVAALAVAVGAAGVGGSSSF